jgi:hypothetical protein
MTIEVPVRRSGRCCGIIQWLRLEMMTRWYSKIILP